MSHFHAPKVVTREVSAHTVATALSGACYRHLHLAPVAIASSRGLYGFICKYLITSDTLCPPPNVLLTGALPLQALEEESKERSDSSGELRCGSNEDLIERKI